MCIRDSINAEYGSAPEPARGACALPLCNPLPRFRAALISSTVWRLLTTYCSVWCRHVLQPYELISSMGKLFLEYLSGTRVYECISCNSHLADADHIISKSFQGQHGRAFLFENV
eukprot:TRINITY_DN415_c0_g1_i14.p1 TRINITY_DN415_c0_g1~~TRINITY_DN415_c0_g1_i14.p1  ORF type:complete len:115 (+),score=15.61 TRINITY_DN415_c0_g1_i14:164-508(+)